MKQRSHRRTRPSGDGVIGLRPMFAVFVVVVVIVVAVPDAMDR